jgi:inner membrane protein
MLAFTHVAAGCASSLLVAEYMHATPVQTLLIMAGGIIGSHLPDIDHPKSAFGSRVLPLSIPISTVFGHRGITHSLLAVAGMSWLIWWSLYHGIKAMPCRWWQASQRATCPTLSATG